MVRSKVDNRRKAMVLSFTFAELGQVALWAVPVCVRSQMLHAVKGGWSCMLKHCLLRQLCGPDGLATAGMVLDLAGEPLLAHARLTNLLTDGDGWRSALDWRGHASLKPCFKHYNVLRKVLCKTHASLQRSVGIGCWIGGCWIGIDGCSEFWWDGCGLNRHGAELLHNSWVFGRGHEVMQTCR